MIYAIYLLIGSVASFLSGLLGIGGGLIMVPSLLFTFSQFGVVNPAQTMHVVIGTSLASSLVNLLASVRAHALRGSVDWSIIKRMAVGLVLGAFILGPGILRHVPNTALKGFFGGFCLFMSLQLLLQRAPTSSEDAHLPQGGWLIVMGLLIGLLSTLLGLAGGVMLGLLLNHYRLSMHRVIGTGAAGALVIAIAGTLGLVFVPHEAQQLPAYCTGYVYWPALICLTLPGPFLAKLGVAYAHRVPVQRLRRWFACLVMLTGLQMLLTVMHLF